MTVIGNISNLKFYAKTGIISSVTALTLLGVSCNNKQSNIDKTLASDVFQKNEFLQSDLEPLRGGIKTSYIETNGFDQWEVKKFNDGSMVKVLDLGNNSYDYEDYYPNGKLKSYFGIEKIPGNLIGYTVEVYNDKGQQIYYEEFSETCRDGADECLKFDKQGRIIEDIDGTYQYNDDGSYTNIRTVGKCKKVIFKNSNNREIKTIMIGEDGSEMTVGSDIYRKLNAPKRFLEMLNK